MASAFAHALGAVAMGHLANRGKMGLKLGLLLSFCAIFPDADVISFQIGIPYEHVLGHRGITHSLLFSLVFAMAITRLFYRKTSLFSKKGWGLTLLFFLATASHALLDAMTTGGLGVAFFAPFDNSRYFLPWRPIQVSPIGVANFFSEWGWRVIKSELIWVGIPSALLLLLSKFIFNKG